MTKPGRTPCSVPEDFTHKELLITAGKYWLNTVTEEADSPAQIESRQVVGYELLDADNNVLLSMDTLEFARLLHKAIEWA